MRWRGGLVAVALAIAVLLLPARPASAGEDPTGHWSLDTSAITDDVGGHDGTASGTTVTEGAVDDALEFASGDYVSIKDDPAFEPDEITVSAWVKRSGSPGSYSYIVSKGDQDCYAASYAFYTSGGSGLSWYIYDGGTGIGLSPDVGPGVWDGAWHNVVGTYDGAMLHIYLDGAEVGTGSPSTLAIGYGLTENDLNIGGYGSTASACGATTPYTGAIDDVTLWARALEPAEIADIAGVDGAPTTTAPTTTAPGVVAAPPATTTPAAHPVVVNADQAPISIAVQDPGDVSFSPADLAKSALASIAILLLIVFPSQLFNSTLEENYDEVHGWFRSLRAKLPGGGGERSTLWDSWPGFAAFMAIAAGLYSVLSPDWGVNTASAVGFVGIFIGLIVVTLLFAYPVRQHHRRQLDDPGRIHVAPATLLVAAGCVILSRVAHFQPGYLYGLIAGFAFVQVLPKDDEGRVLFKSALGLLGFGLVAWVLRAPLDSSIQDSGASAGLLILDSVLAAIFVGAVEGLVFGMIPLRFIPGEKVWAWNKDRWLLVAGAGTFLFVHVLLDPSSHYLVETDNTSRTTTMVLFGLFGLASVCFWAWFRVHPKVDATAP